MSIDKSKKVVFSGIQPSGIPALGNYIGAMMNFKALQDEYDCLYCVVDLHAITVRRDPKTYGDQIRRLFAIYVAAGLDPEKNIIFVQSHVPAHSQLSWILNCYTYVGELGRMTQFKDKSRKHEENVNAGLFNYPVLQAADVLLYGTHLVPVGQDQKQHLELARDIAIRFNKVYGKIFTVPEILIPKVGARIMKLQDPFHKMDKSEVENLNNSIFLLDEPDVIISKLRKAVTDSEAVVRYGEDKPGVSNLLTIYSCLTGTSIPDAEREFEGKNYGFFKNAVGEAAVAVLEPIQNEYKRLMSDRGALDAMMKPGAEKAEGIAKNMLKRVHDAIGFI
ncbi:MAG: tryptophan--tRNA ligase [Defluviitaleaceae bacterium]|nr:tryptophan--tRNA ligase [Defluviitaleaceae bacterium]MCL2837185.1 tryptophan--tRNA ligase [Defluviitaleaceae bacterium]